MFSFLLTMLVFGSLVLFFSSSPYFGVFGVLVQAMSFSIMCSLLGCSFLSLLLVLIYVGGLLVVFLFSTSLSAESYPMLLFKEMFLFWIGFLMLFYSIMSSDKSLFFVDVLLVGSFETECEFGELYGVLSLLTIYVILFLLIALMAVLFMNFEYSKSNLRSI